MTFEFLSVRGMRFPFCLAFRPVFSPSSPSAFFFLISPVPIETGRLRSIYRSRPECRRDGGELLIIVAHCRVEIKVSGGNEMAAVDSKRDAR